MRKLNRQAIAITLLITTMVTGGTYIGLKFKSKAALIASHENYIGQLQEELKTANNDLELTNKKLEETQLLNEEYFNKNNELNSLLNSMEGIEFEAEISYYSPLESVNPPGWESMNCMGYPLQDGDYAAPDFIPLHSKILVTFEDGTQEIGTVVDRGNTDIIKIFTRDDTPILEGTKMRLDKFVWDPTGKGLDIAKVKIIRWGKGNE